MTKRKYTPISVSLSHTEAQIQEAAEQMGLEGGAEELKRHLLFAGHMRHHAEKSGCTPPETIGLLLDFIGQILREAYDEEQHAELITDITEYLWAITGMTSDTADTNVH